MEKEPAETIRRTSARSVSGFGPSRVSPFTAHYSPFLCCCLLALAAARLSADGGFFSYEDARWRQVTEKEQTALISYQGGYENMLLAVKLDSFHSTKAAWVFPVPAEPGDVAIDVVPELPEFHGREITGFAHQTIAKLFSVMALSQIYPIAFMNLRRPTSAGPLEVPFGVGSALAAGSGGVEVYQHLVRLGLTTEVIAARDRNAPYDYLMKNGLELPDKAKAILGEYVGRAYSFVVSWISDTARFLPDRNDGWRREWADKQVALSVAFHTDSVYFPLKLSSVYGGLRIPITINVLGYVAPNFPENLRSFAQATWYTEEGYVTSSELAPFFKSGNHLNPLRYSMIAINAPARLLTEDLRISARSPKKATSADWLVYHVWPFSVALFAFASLLASSLAAVASFRDDRRNRNKFIWTGLLNFTTLAGVAVAAVLIRTGRSNASPPPGPASFSGWDARKLLYLVLFAALFMGIVLMTAGLLRLLT